VISHRDADGNAPAGSDWQGYSVAISVEACRSLSAGPDYKIITTTAPLAMFVSPKFSLRFPINELDIWAAKYDARKDRDAQTVADKAKERGFLTKEEFLTIAHWKSPRPKRWAQDNSDTDIKDASQSALSTTDARVRMGVLTTLSGVSYPTASAILHLVCKDVPLLDFRALAAFNVNPPSSYGFLFWAAYCVEIFKIKNQCPMSLRVIDRALWCYGREHPLS
jgi:hypothetical protein